MTGFRWESPLLVALFVANFVGLVFLGYGWAQAPPIVIERAGMDAQGYAVIIGAIFSGIATLLGVWVTYQNTKIKARTEEIKAKTEEVAVHQETLKGQMDGMKDALVKSEKAIAKTEGREEVIAEQKADAGVRAVIRAEERSANPVDHTALATRAAAEAAPPAAAVAAPPAAATSAPPAAEVAAPPAVDRALAARDARDAADAIKPKPKATP